MKYIFYKIEVDNSASSTGYSSNQYACENTKDKIFLLSYKEANKNNLGFGSSSDRIKQPTDFALANNASKSLTEGEGGYWWLRSYNDYNYASAVVTVGDNYCHGVYIDNYGVVPALTISE